MEVPDGEEHEKRTASIFKAIIAKNFPKRSGHPDSWSPKDSKQVEPDQGYTKTHYKQLLKVKDKERTLKAAREEGTPIRLQVDFSSETFRPGESGMIY